MENQLLQSPCNLSYNFLQSNNKFPPPPQLVIIVPLTIYLTNFSKLVTNFSNGKLAIRSPLQFILKFSQISNTFSVRKLAITVLPAIYIEISQISNNKFSHRKLVIGICNNNNTKSIIDHFFGNRSLKNKKTKKKEFKIQTPSFRIRSEENKSCQKLAINNLTVKKSDIKLIVFLQYKYIIHNFIV